MRKNDILVMIKLNEAVGDALEKRNSFCIDYFKNRFCIDKFFIFVILA